MALRHAARTTLRLARPALTRSYADAAPSAAINFTFTTGAGTFFDQAEVEQINVPSTDGDFGILPSHVPVIAALKPGVVSVTQNGSVTDYFVSSGVVTVNDDSSTQVIAEEAALLEDLDINAARKGLDEYTSKLAAASDDVAKAEAEIGVEVYSAMIKALE